MKIAGRAIGGVKPPYIIAELSGNHCGSLFRAKELIRAAKKAGADAVKTQCYEPDTITIDCKKPDFIVQSGLWYGRSLYELYGKAHTPFAWHRDLYKLAKDEDIVIFSSVFDKTSVDLLEELDCPAYKIASFEIVDIPLIEYATETGKPLIISTGLATDRDILDANEASGKSAAFLHCTSEYPGTIDGADLMRMARIDMLLKGQNPVGISDHTPGNVIPVAATALRALIIEKHLKLGRGEKSEDDAFSIDPGAFKLMSETVRQVHFALTPGNASSPSRQCQKSIYAVQDIDKDEAFTEENIRVIRPGYGLHPRHFKKLIEDGVKATRNYRRGDPVQKQ